MKFSSPGWIKNIQERHKDDEDIIDSVDEQSLSDSQTVFYPHQTTSHSQAVRRKLTSDFPQLIPNTQNTTVIEDDPIDNFQDAFTIDVPPINVSSDNCPEDPLDNLLDSYSLGIELPPTQNTPQNFWSHVICFDNTNLDLIENLTKKGIKILYSPIQNNNSLIGNEYILNHEGITLIVIPSTTISATETDQIKKWLFKKINGYPLYLVIENSTDGHLSKNYEEFISETIEMPLLKILYSNSPQHSIDLIEKVLHLVDNKILLDIDTAFLRNYEKEMRFLISIPDVSFVQAVYLLKKFKDMKSIIHSGVEDLEIPPYIDNTLALTIYTYFRVN